MISNENEVALLAEFDEDSGMKVVKLSISAEAEVVAVVLSESPAPAPGVWLVLLSFRLLFPERGLGKKGSKETPERTEGALCFLNALARSFLPLH